ncbi:M28 family peptidase [Chloroflexota bacterium]
MTKSLTSKAEKYLRRLCVDIPSRRVGSAGNRAATDLFARTVASFGFETESPEFRCIDWSHDGVDLEADGIRFEAFPSPYSLGCRVTAPLTAASTVSELEGADVSGHILLLRRELAREQLMPKNFPFYNPDSHRQLIESLEEKAPLAIIAATAQDLNMVGAQYPFPLFEDGDFDIPSVYMTDVEGAKLAAVAGSEVLLESRALRIPSSGCNVIARKSPGQARRVVLFAHIDSRMGTPGANDNASGVVVLLLLAELLADYAGQLGIEMVAMNGEDYYSNPGEQQFLQLNEGRFDDVALGINLDDVAYYKGGIAYSLYNCSPEIDGQIRDAFAAYPGMVEGKPWFQGDHGLFLMNGVPALAVTSELLGELMAEITHTARDTPEIVDPAKLVTTACAIRDLLLQLAAGSA